MCCLLLFFLLSFNTLHLTLKNSHNQANTNNHNIEWKTQNDSTCWCDVKDALFFYCSPDVVYDFSYRFNTSKNEVKGQVGNRVNSMAPGVKLGTTTQHTLLFVCCTIRFISNLIDQRNFIEPCVTILEKQRWAIQSFRLNT